MRERIRKGDKITMRGIDGVWVVVGRSSDGYLLVEPSSLKMQMAVRPEDAIRVG